MNTTRHGRQLKCNLNSSHIKTESAYVAACRLDYISENVNHLAEKATVGRLLCRVEFFI